MAGVVLAAGLTTGGAQAVIPSDPLVISWTYAAKTMAKTLEAPYEQW